MLIVTNLLGVMYILLSMAIGWQFCNAQQEDMDIEVKPNVYKMVNNNSNEIGVESSFLNLKIKTPIRDDFSNQASKNSEKVNNRDLQSIKTSQHVEISDGNKINLKRKKNQFRQKSGNEALIGYERSNDKHYDSNKNNSECKNEINIINVYSKNRGAKQKKSVIPHNKEHKHKNKSVMPNLQEFKAAHDSGHETSWAFNDEGHYPFKGSHFDQNKTLPSHNKLTNPTSKNKPLKNRNMGESFQDSKYSADGEIIEKDHYNKQNIRFKQPENLKNENEYKHSHIGSNISETNLKSSLNNRKYKNSETRKHSLKLTRNGSEKYKIRHVMKLNDKNPLQDTNRDTNIKRHERDINRRFKNMNVIVPNIKKKTDEVFERRELGEKIQPYDQAPDNYFNNKNDKQYLSYEPTFGKTHLYGLPNDKPHYPENMFVERTQLSNIKDEAEIYDDSTGHLKTSFQPNTTNVTKTTTCFINQGLNKTTPELNKIPHKTTKTNTVSVQNNTNQEQSKEYENFLSGRMADDFVKAVLSKVARSRKIILELGFGNDTDETCERCAELKPNNIPEIVDMKQSMEMLSTQDMFKCYRIPVPMESFLNLLLFYKLENKKGVYKKVEDENFIFTKDYLDSVSRTDNGVRNNNNCGNIDVISKDTSDKQRLKEESFEENNDGKIINKYISNFSGSRSKIHKNVIPAKDRLDSQDSENERKKNYFDQPSKYLKSNNNAFIIRTILQSNPTSSSFYPRKNSYSLEDSLDSSVDKRHIYNKRMDLSNYKPDYTRESDHEIERDTRKLNYKKENSDIYENNKICKELQRPQYREELSGMKTGPDSSFRSWSSNLEDLNFKSKDVSLKDISSDFLNLYFNPRITNNQQKDDHKFDFISNEYSKGEEFTNKPKLSMNLQQDDYLLYPKQQGLDVDNSQIVVPRNRRDFDDETMVIKRDTSEPYQDDSSIFYEVSDIEYDLY